MLVIDKLIMCHVDYRVSITGNIKEALDPNILISIKAKVAYHGRICSILQNHGITYEVNQWEFLVVKIFGTLDAKQFLDLYFQKHFL